MVRRCYHQMTVGKSLGCDRVVAYRRAMAIMFSSIIFCAKFPVAGPAPIATMFVGLMLLLSSF